MQGRDFIWPPGKRVVYHRSGPLERFSNGRRLTPVADSARAENEKDRVHIVGKLSDGVLTVPAAGLAKYAAAYAIRGRCPCGFNSRMTT
jgi:hypothetical protein